MGRLLTYQRNALETASIRIFGPLTGVRVEALRALLQRVARLGPRHVSIDLSDSPTLDSSAVALLLLALQRARQRGLGFSVRGLHHQPRQLLHLYGLDCLSELTLDAHHTAAGPDAAPGNTAEGAERRPSLGDPLPARPAVPFG
ncbi:MAG: STAS domain-containing protein [Candidatus Acidiferrales bacterium]